MGFRRERLESVLEAWPAARPETPASKASGWRSAARPDGENGLGPPGAEQAPCTCIFPSALVPDVGRDHCQVHTPAPSDHQELPALRGPTESEGPPSPTQSGRALGPPQLTANVWGQGTAWAGSSCPDAGPASPGARPRPKFTFPPRGRAGQQREKMHRLDLSARAVRMEGSLL